MWVRTRGCSRGNTARGLVLDIRHGFTANTFAHVVADGTAARVGAVVGIDALWENPHCTIAANDFYQLDGKNSAFRILEPCD